ncbi:MAG: cytochrome c [Roseiflexaceae bacterium]|nr:cytochrome c [Roseiflexaceae bacterium]
MDYLGLGALVVGCVIFALLAYRAVRARRLWLKLVGGIPSALLALVFGGAAALAFIGYNKLNAVRPNPVPQLTATMNTEAITRGETFARTCAGCHSSNGNLPLTGQDFLGEDSGPPIGTLWAANLTPAQLAAWSDGEIVRAIREGVGRDGRSLMIMPASAFHGMSDDDVLALVAYLRSQPAVEPSSPPRQVNVLGAILLAAVIPDSIFSAQAPITSPIAAPPRASTPEYGGYLIHLGCQDCHGSDFRGLAAGGDGPPPGPDLIDFAKTHTVAEFVSTLRTGVKPDGTPLNEDMPWRDLEKFSDDDFAAMALYLQTLN